MGENENETKEITLKNMPMDISEFKKDLEPAFDIFERLKKFSTWMITIAFGSLGFFVTLIFQLKFDGYIPNRWQAMVVFILLIISILLGLFIRFKFEMMTSAIDLRKATRGMSKILQKIVDENALSGDGAKYFGLLGSALEKKMRDETAKSLKPLTPWSIFGQMATLGLGLIFFGIYIGLFLF
jgi:hypothetical protein